MKFECNRVEIDQNVEIWVQNVKSIKMLKFEYKVRSIKMLKFERKTGDRSNVDILLQKWKLIKILEFDWKLSNLSEWDNVGNWSKCWNLSAKCHFDQMLKFERKAGDWSNVDILLQKWKSINKFGIWLEIKELIRMGQRWKLIKMLKFECKMSLRSICWNLSEKGIQIDQNAEIWVKGGNQWKIWNLKTKSGINQNAENWVLIDKSIKMLKFEWKGNNQSKCWNLSANVGIDQNVEIWEKRGRSIKCWYFIAKVGIDQNFGIWLKVRNWSECWHLSTKSWELIKMLKLKC